MRLFAGTEFDIPPRCETCGDLEENCACPEPTPAPIDPGKQTAQIRREKRKKGKTVSVIRGLSSQGNALPPLLKDLKNVCGAGGTIKEDDVIEIQGDHVERIEQFLKNRGYRTRVG